MVYDEFKRTNIQSSDESNSDEVVQSEDDSLQWAKEAYARLKAQQIEQQKKRKEKEETLKIESLDSKDAFTIESDQEIKKLNIENNQLVSEKIEEINESNQINDLAENELLPNLGDFDESFTWSAEVLAAQGRKSDDISVTLLKTASILPLLKSLA